MPPFVPFPWGKLSFFLGVGEAYVQRREHVLGQQKSQRFSGEQKGIPYVN